VQYYSSFFSQPFFLSILVLSGAFILGTHRPEGFARCKNPRIFGKPSSDYTLVLPTSGLRGQLFHFRSAPPSVVLFYTSSNPRAPTHEQKARRSQEKKMMITCRDISVHHPRSREKERERERWKRLETWSECDAAQQQVHYCAVFSRLFVFFLHSNGSQTVTNQRLCICVFLCNQQLSPNLSFSLSLSVCACLSLRALWPDREAKSFVRHQANKAGNSLETPLKVIIIIIIVIMAIEVHERRLLLPPPSAVPPTSLSAFYSAPKLNKLPVCETVHLP
jgi:hypothetical protein